MSVILGKIFAKRANTSNKATLLTKEDTMFRKHVTEHEVLDEYYGHEHSDGHGEKGHTHEKHSVKERLTSASPTTKPSFMLHLWSALPILLLAFGGGAVVVFTAVLAALINFFIIQMRVHTSKRYVASGVVSFMAWCVYLVVT